MKRLVSFGFRHGGPPRGGAWIDVRKLFARNPHNVYKLRPLRGDHPDVVDYIEKGPEFTDCLRRLRNRVAFLFEKHEEVFLGCTGGHHRSVYLVNRLSRDLGCEASHRDYNKN